MEDLYKNYRIVVTTEKSGKQWYQVEKRVFWFFWVGKMLAKRSQSEAEAIIDYLIDRDIEEIESEVLNKKILYYPKNKD